MAHKLSDVLGLLRRLDEAHIHSRLSTFRQDAIAIEVAVPGERWEIEFLEDGSIEVERYRSGGAIQDESAIEELFARFSDQDDLT